MSFPRFVGALCLLLASVSASASAATFTVTNTSDTGAGSLRAAIDSANSTAGPDTIAFDIPGSGVHTIVPQSDLPPITEAVTIDGYTQTGASANTLAVGSDAVILVEIVPPSGGGTRALEVTAASVTIRGLCIHGFGAEIDISEAGAVVIAGNFLGLLPDGSDAGLQESYGVLAGPGFTVRAPDGTPTPNRIGTPAAADRNVISGHSVGNIGAEFADHLSIENNYIGTNAAGTAAVAEQDDGIRLNGATFTTIGAAAPGAGNLISGNDGAFNWGSTASGAITVRGNLIGTDATGTLPIPNAGTIYIFNGSTNIVIGGIGAGEGNTIAFGDFNGITVTNATLLSIRGNSIHDNARLGIGFDPAGVPTPNDPLDADGKQNFPIVKSVDHGSGTTRVQGKLGSSASTTFNLDFYANPACPRFPREFLEGETYLGSSPATTDASGATTFDVTLPIDTEAGARISVTATPVSLVRNTSEFSQRILFSITPSSGPASGGTAFTGSGTDLAGPAAVTVGGVAATGVSVPDSQTLQATSPALPAGTVNDVVVTTPDGTTGTLVKGWVSDFLDVPAAHPFHAFVTTLVSNAVAAGVGGGNYGVDQPTLRQQMAVFLLKAKHGVCFTPPACSGVFADVPCSSPFAPWIEQLAAEQITGGCGGGNYCPGAPVRRDQMAVFLMKAEHGSGFTPPPCAGTFADVPCSSPFAPWIEQLAAEQITGGCGGGNYCPSSSNTRGQMAVFVVKTFDLQ